MSFEADAATVGRQADQVLQQTNALLDTADTKITALEQQVSDLQAGVLADGQIIAGLQSDKATLSGQVTTLQGQVAALIKAEAEEDKPPTPTVYGTSAGPVLTQSVSQIGAKRVRTYTPTQLDVAVPLRIAVFHSRKVDQAKMAAGDPVEIGIAEAEFTRLPDVAGCSAAIDHERNNDQTTLPLILADAAQYQAAWVVFLQIVARVNTGRVNKIWTVPTTTGDVLNHPGGMDPWYVPGADRMGFDVYVAANLPKVAAYAATKGKDWVLPEWGYVAGGTASSATDAQKAARIASDVALFESFPNPPKEVFIFNNNGSVINGCPLSIAAMKSLCSLG